MNYRPRIADNELLHRLQVAGAVLIEGPKACGKTATAMQAAASHVLLDIDEENRQAAAVAPDMVLSGDTPRLIDEWQLEPRIWNNVRRTVDRRGLSGQFILTGSAVPADDVVRHTGAGRISRLRMRPMSLYETGRSNGTISLAGLLDGEEGGCAEVPVRIEDLADWITRGGWPALIDRPDSASRTYVRDYIDEVRRADIRRVDGVDRDPVRVGRVIRSFARHVGTYAAISTIATDAAGADLSLSAPTAAEYLRALERLMIVEDQPAWAPHLRSRSTMRSASKRHFVDPSIAAAAIGATSERLVRDLKYFGFLFESLVVRDLRIYAQALGASVLQYRDNTGLEVDAIIERPDGTWMAVEVKLGSSYIDGAAANLLKFANRVDTERTGSPSTLAVIVPGGYGYLRKDGVRVVPVAALGP